VHCFVIGDTLFRNLRNSNLPFIIDIATFIIVNFFSTELMFEKLLKAKLTRCVDIQYHK